MFLKVVFAFLATCSVVVSAEIKLSPTGPISTPQAARDAARKASKPVRIVVESGVYSITEPIVLGVEDSQVSWEAAPGAKPVITGGVPITGWEQTSNGIWKATIPEVKAGKWFFEQIWINGRRATRARTPNKGFFNISGAVGPKVFPDVKEGVNFRAFAIAPKQFDLVKSIPKEERDGVLITVTHAWAVGQCRIEAIDDMSQAILIKNRAAYPFVEFEPDQRYWLENFSEALDAPGEWFLDKRKGELFYKPLPGEDMTKAKVFAPKSDKFFEIKGAKEIDFKGLRFLHGNYTYPEGGLHDGQAATKADGAIEIEDSSNINIHDCEIAYIGRHAIYFKNGCSNSSVTHCKLHDIGGGGVRVGETNRPTEERICRQIVIDDCIIQHGGRLHPSACGVVLTHTQNCSVIHCDIGDFYYTGVSAGWNWGYGESLSRESRIENNHIHHLGWAYLSDMGGFYGLGTSPGTLVRGNHIHHIASHRYGGWGLYNDEGSSDVLMENNLVHDTSNSGFHQHYGYANRVRNNIFAFGRSAQIQRSRNEGRLCFIYEKNIVVWDPSSLLLDGGEYNWQVAKSPERGEPKDSAIFRKNLYWTTDGKQPPFLTRTHFSWKEWQAMGRDKESLFADPMFENIEKRDFRLKPNSPAAKIGFKPWDFSIAGVRNDRPEGIAWRAIAAQGHQYPNWESDAKPWKAPDYEVPMQTFENTAVGLIGIRNAKYERAKGQPDLGESIAVTDETSSPLAIDGVLQKTSKHSLKFQDAPGLAKNFEPVLDIATSWDSGTINVTFDTMGQPKADWFFESRTSSSGEYGAGPMISWKKGILYATLGDKVKLADIPPGEWFRVAITATTGSGTFDVKLTRQDGTSKEFKRLVCKPTWNQAGYLLFSSLGTTKTAFFIDNIALSRTKSQ
jgi:hypothetical protein